MFKANKLVNTHIVLPFSKNKNVNIITSFESDIS